MPGTNYASVATAIVFCFVQTLLPVQVNDARSREAATILDRAIVQFEKLSDKPPRIKADIRFKLVYALTKNRQYLIRTYERSNELLQNKEKLDLLPRAVQISLLLRRAHELLRNAR